MVVVGRWGGYSNSKLCWNKDYLYAFLNQFKCPQHRPKKEGHPLNLKKAVSIWEIKGVMTLKSPNIDFLTFEKIKNKFSCVQLGKGRQLFGFLSLLCKDTLKITRN